MRKIYVPLEGVEFGRHTIDEPEQISTEQLLGKEGTRLLGTPFSIDFAWVKSAITKPTMLGSSAQKHSRALYEARFELEELQEDGEISSLTTSSGVTVRFVDLARAITRFRYNQSIDEIRKANASRTFDTPTEF